MGFGLIVERIEKSPEPTNNVPARSIPRRRPFGLLFVRDLS